MNLTWFSHYALEADDGSVLKPGPVLSGASQEAGRGGCRWTWASSGGQSHPADPQASSQCQGEDSGPHHQCCVRGPEEAGPTNSLH